MIAAMSPSEINCLDPDTGEIETILAAPDKDYLLPMMTADGTLYCIQAPYQRVGSYSFGTLLLDIILFPWRMCVAIFGFLNAFSMFFAKKSLKTTGGPALPPVDISRRMLHNRLLDIEAIQKKERKRVAAPHDWKLIQVSGGRQSVVASNVLWYTLDEASKPIYTDGFAIHADGGRTLHGSDGLITALSLASAAHRQE
jgi:hypothetical protein